MSPNTEPRSTGFRNSGAWHNRDVDIATVFNRSLVLVIGDSNINNVVVSRIAERAGLKAVCVSLASAFEYFDALLPSLVILDVGAHDDEACHAILAQIAACRAARVTDLPLVVMLTTANPPASRYATRPVSSIVAKPITPDRLQPIISTLHLQVRNAA